MNCVLGLDRNIFLSVIEAYLACETSALTNKRPAFLLFHLQLGA